MRDGVDDQHGLLADLADMMRDVRGEGRARRLNQSSSVSCSAEVIAPIECAVDGGVALLTRPRRSSAGAERMN